MFTTVLHNVVDHMQSAKKQFVDTFVSHTEINKALHEFVEAQSEYTKKAIDTGMNTATAISYSLYTELLKFNKVK